MMRSFTPSHSGLFVLLPLLFSHAAMSELLGCDAVGCPVDQYRNAHCELGNATLKAIGVANVTTTLDPRPLTWTLGLQESQDPENNSQPIFDRNFYLGTPASLQLENTTGCALFFEGVAANLTVPDGNRADNFTCSDALSGNCVSDLIEQAQSVAKGIVANATNLDDADFCKRLRESLVDSPPSTCNGVRGSWGTVIAQSLTGDTASEHINQTQCHPTTGQDYDLSLVASERKQPSSREWSQLYPVLEAITPVMMVINNGDAIDAELTCLKLVQSEANQTTDEPQDSSAGFKAPFVFHLALVAISFIFVL